MYKNPSSMPRPPRLYSEILAEAERKRRAADDKIVQRMVPWRLGSR